MNPSREGGNITLSAGNYTRVYGLGTAKEIALCANDIAKQRIAQCICYFNSILAQLYEPMRPKYVLASTPVTRNGNYTDDDHL